LNEFNNYYINVGKNISDEINTSSYNKFNWNELNKNCYINDFIYLDPIHPFEISNFVRKIPENSSYFINDLSNFILKKTADTISIPLPIIFNFSIVSGKYPSTYKDTTLLLLLKSGEKKLYSNYRPIALTLTISTIFEKDVKKILINFLNKHTFFSPNQYGFHPNMSTTDSLVKTSHSLHDNLDKKFKIFGIFLDFKKAFDSVNHEL
jgi:hypothetical protein